MQTLALLDGTAFPAFGLGTWLSEPDAVYRAVRVAIEQGYRHIDAAWIYLNEEEVGRGIAEAIAAGDVAREDLWVTTKLWNDCHAPEHVQPALERSLDKLGLDYVDLYLVHWPVALKHKVVRPRGPAEYLSLAERPLEKTWDAMVQLPKTGLAKRVGVSNFSASKIAHIVEAVGVTPVVNQVELHPYNQQNELLAAMKARGIVATGYSPLGSGGRPPGMKREGETSLLADSTVGSIAEAHGHSPAQVLIAWALARGTAVIPKSTNPERIAANLAATKLSLTPEDMQALAGLDEGARYVDGSFWCPPGSPYTVESLWA
ncbi:MAG: aldo/keto reductase [Myxococcota bacterium]